MSNVSWNPGMQFYKPGTSSNIHVCLPCTCMAVQYSNIFLFCLLNSGQTAPRWPWSQLGFWWQVSDGSFTFTFSHLADALIQSDLQYRDIPSKASRVKCLAQGHNIIWHGWDRISNLQITSPTPSPLSHLAHSVLTCPLRPNLIISYDHHLLLTEEIDTVLRVCVII